MFMQVITQINFSIKYLKLRVYLKSYLSFSEEIPKNLFAKSGNCAQLLIAIKKKVKTKIFFRKFFIFNIKNY